MKTRLSSRILAMLLVLVMVFSAVPTAVFAADSATDDAVAVPASAKKTEAEGTESDQADALQPAQVQPTPETADKTEKPADAQPAAAPVYTKITTLAELTSGRYVMLVDTGLAPLELDSEGGWLLTAQPVAGDTVTDDKGAVWYLAVDGTNVKLTDKNGQTVSFSGKKVSAGDFSWGVACENGVFTFSTNETEARYLSSNSGSQGKFRPYKPGQYSRNFTLYKSSVTDPFQPQEPPVTPPEQPAEKPDESNAVSIADALKAAIETVCTVKGVVTAVDDKNIYLQDSTGAICLRITQASEEIHLGDTLLGKGSLADYNGTPQLKNGIWEKSSGMELKARTTTIGALTKADICTYVKIKNAEVTDVFSETGWKNPNITINDGTGSLQIYKAVVNKDDAGEWTVKKGDKVDVFAAVGFYSKSGNEKFQLRNTVPEQIIPAGSQDDPIETIPDGAMSIPDACAAVLPLENVSVVGQVVYKYGSMFKDAPSLNSIILEDKIDGKIYGIQIYDYKNIANYHIGDVVKVTGKVENRNGVIQMGFPAMEVVQTGLDPIPAQEITVSQLGSDYLSEYVYIKNVTLGKLNINERTDVEDATGKTVLFKGNALPAGKTEKDVIGVYGACSAFKENFQLRNGGENDYEFKQPGLIEEGQQVVIYNVSAKGILGMQSDNVQSPSILHAASELKNDTVAAGNGGLVFTVERNGDFYRFRNDTFGYLASNGTGNNAFYTEKATNEADWVIQKLEKVPGSFSIQSVAAAFKGHPVFLEYYSNSYKTYGMDPNKVKDYTIYAFNFYPVSNDPADLVSGVVNTPEVAFSVAGDAYLTSAFNFQVTVNAVFGIQELTVSANGKALTANEDGSYTVPADQVTGSELTLTVTGKDTVGTAIHGEMKVPVLDEPIIEAVDPKPNAQTLGNKRPVISVQFANVGEKPAITMKLNGKEVKTSINGNKVSYTPDADMADGKVTMDVTIRRADGKTVSKNWFFTVGKAQYQLYFGQLHSHTTYSDGAGSLESALDYVSKIPEEDNIDFVAFTDHSNYFDEKGNAIPEQGMYDMSLAPAESQKIWKKYKDTVAAFNAKQSDIIALGGFEMTWSGGPGHINTFNTPGIVSRNNDTLNNKTNDAGMKAYYALLCQPEGRDSLSQFNHPGSTFGTFSDFAHWDALIDTRMYTVEVGNGEGQIGAGGYYPSYEYYTMALDKGWHVAPTNNQDNHKGRWGNANTARDVILTDDFSEQGIYEAIRNYRMYATEDKNLELGYTLNGQMMGAIIPEEDIPDSLDINVTTHDPDAGDSITKVEVIVNSGNVAYTWDDPAELATGDLKCSLKPDYTYYYIKVTEGDGDLAVTAPVWVGESLKLGISSVENGTAIPVTGEPMTLTTTLFNSELTPATVKSVTYAVKGGKVLGVDQEAKLLPASGTLAVDFSMIPDAARVFTVTVTAVIEMEGKEFTFTKDIALDVQDDQQLVYIGFDAAHYNEYVAGNYKDSMGNFANLASQYQIRTVYLKTSEELIAACSNPKYKAIFLTAPSRRLGEAQKAMLSYTDAELAALKQFHDDGKTLVLAGWSDHYEDFPQAFPNGLPAEKHMAAVQNQILETIGSSLRINDDATYDDKYSAIDACDPWRLYFNSYGEDFLTDGVIYDADHPYDRLYTEVFSHYGGASIQTVDGKLPATVTPLVYGHESTYSKDTDRDGLGGSNKVVKYPFAKGDDRLLIMASEQLEGKGLVIVSGAAFMSNFEVQAEIKDNNAEKNYSNYRICENLLKYLNPAPITPIAAVQAQTDPGYKFTVEGIVTSNASGYDKTTAFFDCIYIQDETAGINVFPVAGNYKVGDKVRITGVTSSYQGEQQLQMTEIERIDEGHKVTPREISAEQLNDGSVLGQLVTVKGYVESFEASNGLIQTIMVRDEIGDLARIFIDGYITTAEDVKNLKEGATVTATGLASYDNTFNAPEGPFPRMRIRSRADVVCGKIDENYVPNHTHQFEWTITKMPTETTPGEMIGVCSCGHVIKKEIPILGFSGDVIVESGKNNDFSGKLTTTDIISKLILTNEERRAILAGEDLKVTLEVQDISNTVSDGDKKLVEAAMDSYNLGMYLDISISKQIGNGEKNLMHQSREPIEISITVPENLRGAGRSFSMIRVHDGKTDTIRCTYDEKTGTLIFATDRFSTYALVYQDAKTPVNPDRPATGDNSNTTLYVVLIVAAVVVLGVVLVSNKKKKGSKN